jgi:sugar phosphate isomerase/epimerase
MRTLGLAHLTMLDADPIELMHAAAAGGFDAVGLRILPPKHSPVPWQVVGNSEMVARIRRTSAELGVRVFDVESFTLHPDTDVAADMRAALETAAEIGAQQVLTTTTDPDPARFADHFAALCDEAAKVGLRVGLEFMMFRDVQTLRQAIDVITASQRPNAAVIIDALHLSRSGGTPADVAAVDPALLAYVQLCDAPARIPPADQLIAEARTGRLYPGEGELWLGELLRALPPAMTVTVEAPCEKYAGLSPTERAILLGRKTREQLEASLNA